jgi:hypothetical protein
MMKFKPNQTRTYDRVGFKKRAACLCFRSELEDEVRRPARKQPRRGQRAGGPGARSPRPCVGCGAGTDRPPSSFPPPSFLPFFISLGR